MLVSANSVLFETKKIATTGWNHIAPHADPTPLRPTKCQICANAPAFSACRKQFQYTDRNVRAISV